MLPPLVNGLEREQKLFVKRMKPSPAIKPFQACCAVAIIVFGMTRAEAGTNVFTFPPIGTIQKVTDYAAKATAVVLIFPWAYQTNGQQAFYGGTTGYIGTNIMTSKIQLDQQFIVPGLSNQVLHSFCTNADPIWDKSRGILVYVACALNTFPLGLSEKDLLWYYDTIQLIRNSDGSYSVPNLSSFSTRPGNPMPFYVPNLQWARVEVGHRGDLYPFEIDDRLYNTNSNPIRSDGYLYLSTDYITNSSSASGNIWMKITTFNGTFQMFDGDGNRIAETPMVLGMTKNQTNAFIVVNGGDSGRGFVLQSSAALTAWTNCSPVTFVSPTNDLPHALPSQFVYPSTNRSLFFRTATTNLPPR